METMALKILFQDFPIAAYSIGILILLGVAIKFFRSIFDFHHDFTRRHLRRVSELMPQTQPDSDLQHFLQRVIADEVFKIASGVKSPRRKAILLMHLCRNDFLPPSQIKPVAPFIEPDPDGQVIIRIGLGDKLLACYSLASTLFIFFYGMISFAFLTWSGGIGNTITGLIICILCTVACLSLSGDFRNYRAIKRLERELKTRTLPICEEIRVPTEPEENTIVPLDNKRMRQGAPA